ncbi:MAG: superoxide dismutase family protein [Betaproteobacteria bacterium]
MNIRLTRPRAMLLGFLVVVVLVLSLSAGQRGSLTVFGRRLSVEAVAKVEGGPLAPGISGTVEFRRFGNGTLVVARIKGLPPSRPGTPPIGPHGFHIHEFGDCQVGDPHDPFQAAGGHWNPTNQPHPFHAGDLPVLLGNHGTAIMSVYTDRFRPQDVIGRSVIIHEHPDDFRSQPAGAAGRRLACGVITAAGRT